MKSMDDYIKIHGKYYKVFRDTGDDYYYDDWWQDGFTKVSIWDEKIQRSLQQIFLH